MMTTDGRSQGEMATINIGNPIKRKDAEKCLVIDRGLFPGPLQTTTTTWCQAVRKKKFSSSRRRETSDRASLMHMRGIKPAKYYGKSCIETFLAQFKICAVHNSWLPKEKLAHLKCAHTDTAVQLIWDSGNPMAITFDELVEKLRRRYGSLDQQEKFQAE